MKKLTEGDWVNLFILLFGVFIFVGLMLFSRCDKPTKFKKQHYEQTLHSRKEFG